MSFISPTIISASVSAWPSTLAEAKSTTSTVLPAYTHLYIVEKSKASGSLTTLVVQKLEQEQSPVSWGSFYKITFDPKKPAGKLYTNNIRFLLARPSDDLDLAHYIVLTKKVTASPVHFRPTADQLAHQFHRLDDVIPIKRHGHSEAKLRRTIPACPSHPKRSNGKECLVRQSHKLPQSLWTDLERISLGHGIPPALVASIIDLESRFNPFLENALEKKICSAGKCSPYAWGRGLGQFGKSESQRFDFTWRDEQWENQVRKKHQKCFSKDTFRLNENCYARLKKECQSYQGPRPIVCPSSAITATVRKLAETLPKRQIIHIAHSDSVDIAPLWNQNAIRKLRMRAGTYNRGARTFSSWENFYNLRGRHPQNYGELWAEPRRPGHTPTMGIGYSILRGEYINRCYVWQVAGLCGKIPETSLYSQYSQQYRSYRENRAIASD